MNQLMEASKGNRDGKNYIIVYMINYYRDSANTVSVIYL